MEGHDEAGELTYSRRGDDVVVAKHTGVPKALRGRGIATQLVNQLIADARSEGFKIVPQCPFVAAQFDKHPDWRYLRQDA